MSLRLCSRAPRTVTTSPVPGRRRAGTGIELLARQVLPGDGRLVGQQAAAAGDRAGVHDVAAVLPRPGPDVDDVVGGADGLLVVLDHDDRVAQVAQPLQRGDEALVVALVQADGGLVEHVEHADQAAADLAGQADALRLSAGQGAGRAGEGQVVEPHIEQELHALAHFLEDAVGDHVLAVAQLQGRHGLDGVGDGEAAQLVDVAAAHGDGQRLGLEPGAAAGGAVHLAHVLLDLLTRPVRLGLAVAALQPRDDALEDRLVGALAVEAVLVGDVHRAVARAVEDELLVLGLERLPRRVEVEAAELGHADLQPGEVLAAGARPRRQRALGQRQGVVGHDQLGVHLELGAQAEADRAGPVGRVEGEAARGRLLEADAAVGAGQVLGEGDGLVGPSSGSSAVVPPLAAALPVPLPFPFITRTSAVPPVSSRAVSIDSVSRWRMLARLTRRSTTTSMVCIS